jgi:NAD(P)H-dependent FMN reductase
MSATRRVLLVSGSLRVLSTNSAAVRTAAQLVPDDATAVVYGGMHELPHFNPDDDQVPLPTAVAALRDEIHAADAIVFCVPEYAGALPGSFKNLLDWTIGDDEPGSIAGKPVAWLNVAPRGAVNAHESLRKVLGYASAKIVETACVHVPVTGSQIGDDGLVGDGSVRDGIAAALKALIAEC